MIFGKLISTYFELSAKGTDTLAPDMQQVQYTGRDPAAAFAEEQSDQDPHIR